MSTIHPSSIIDRRAELADDVEIGPGCVIEGPVVLGPGTRLIGHVYIVGRTCLGSNNLIYPHVCIGFEPQDLKYTRGTPNSGVLIGDNNVLREGVTIHHATHETPTTLGNHNYLMCNSHLGHDVLVANRCILANGSLLAGHVELQDNVILGGGASVHQFCRLGRFSMLSGLIGVVKDIPPFCIAYNMRQVESLNMVGLRRAGYRQNIPNLRTAFRILYLSRHTIARAVQLIEKDLGHDPLCLELAHFVKTSRRGVTPYRWSTETGPGAEHGE